MRRMKRQKEWEKIFAKHVSYKGLVYRVYKELPKLKTKKANNPVRKWVRE